MRRLTNQQLAFVEEFLRNGGHASAAYRIAYPNASSPPRVMATLGSKLKRRPHIADAIARGQAKADRAVMLAIDRYVTDREALATRLVHFAFTDIDQLIELVPVLDQAGNLIDRKVMVRDLDTIDPRARAAIAKLVQSDKGRLSVELPDRRACIMDIARLKGWIVDKPIDTPALVTLKIER